MKISDPEYPHNVAYRLERRRNRAIIRFAVNVAIGASAVVFLLVWFTYLFI